MYVFRKQDSLFQKRTVFQKYFYIIFYFVLVCICPLLILLANYFLCLCLDDASQVDLFQRDSDNDDENEQFDETEVKWRKERFEREQWLREQVLGSF